MPPIAPVHRTPTRRRYGDINRTKEGKRRLRLSYAEKLHKLDVHRPLRELQSLAHAFQQLFAFRSSDAIVTRVGEPRGWYAMRHRLNTNHIARHLLGDNHPCGPQWVGAKSFHTTRFFCIDVDRDPTVEQQVSDNYNFDDADPEDVAWITAQETNRLRQRAARPSFEERCQQAEDALGLLGIDAADPNQVLIQPTPRGGVHYYVFLTESFFVDQCRDLLMAAGLRFKSGHVELYPSTRQGLRLPFGHIPNRRHDPARWINFMEDYRAGRIRRFSLKELYDNLCEQRPVAPSTLREPQNRIRSVGNNGHAISRHCLPAIHKCQVTDGYSQIIRLGPSTTAEAIGLLQLGIQEEGTRTEVLKHLAAHLIWIKGYAATTAADLLTSWAMNPRHRSKDIHSDLSHGTHLVAKHIQRMCQWYEQLRDPGRRRCNTATGEFAPAELDCQSALKTSQ